MTACVGLALLAAPGCVTGSARPGYEYFAAPDPGEAWSRKIDDWQARQRADEGRRAPRSVAGAADGMARTPAAEVAPRLRDKYESFRSERKRALARDVAEWIQRQSAQHYVEDGEVDHWATLEETLRADGDDCDGLELLTYNALLDLGFAQGEVFRAVVFRRGDGQHHMVTLWFEDPGDPWVIDPTGAMTYGMPRMSEVPEWVPLKVFSQDRDFTVRPASLASH